MSTVRELITVWGFQIDDEPLKKMEEGLDHIQSTLVAVGTAAIAAAGSLFGIAKATANAADEITDTAIALGVTNDAIQRLGYAAAQSGASQEILNQSLMFLSRNAMAAASGSKETAAAFQRLGVSVKGADGRMKSADALMMELSDSFKRLPPGIEKSTLAMELFGKSGTKIIGTLNNGAEGIKALGQEAEDLGLLMSDAAIQMGSEFNDELDRLKAIAKGVLYTLGTGLIPIILEVAQSFRAWVLANKEIIKSRLTSFVEGLTKFLSGLWSVTKSLLQSFNFLLQMLKPLTDNLGGLTRVLKTLLIVAGLVALGRLWKSVVNVISTFALLAKTAVLAWRSVLLGPLLIGAAIAAVFLVIDDLIAFMDGRPSMLGFLIENREKIMAAIVEFFNKFKARVMETLGITSTAFNVWAVGIGAVISGLAAAFAWKFVGPVVKGFASIVQAGWKMSVGIVTALNKILIASAATIRGVTNVTASLASAAKKAWLWAMTMVKAAVRVVAQWTITLAFWLKVNAQMALAAVTGAVKSSAAWIANMVRIGVASLAMGAKVAMGWMIAMGPITLVVVAIGAVGAAIYQAVKHWDAIKETFSALWGAFLQGIKNLWTELTLASQAAWKSVSRAGAEAWESLKAAWNGAGEWFRSLWDSFVTMASKIGISLSDALVKPVIDGFISMFAWLKDSLGGLAAKVGIDFDKVQLPEFAASLTPQLASPMSAMAMSPVPQANQMASRAQEQAGMSAPVSNAFDATINVTVPPGTDAAGVGEAVKKSVRDEFDRMMRPAVRATSSPVSY